MNNRINDAGEPGEVIPGGHSGHQPATHFAVPADVFAATRKILGRLPYDDVSTVVQALSQCQGMAIKPRSPSTPVE